MDKELAKFDSKLRAYRKSDTAFASYARLLQSKWRKDELNLGDKMGYRINNGERC